MVKGASNVVNYVNPPRRDVAATGGGGLTIRFTADNPGYVFRYDSPLFADSLVKAHGSCIAISTFTSMLVSRSFSLKHRMRLPQAPTLLILMKSGMIFARFTTR